MQVITDEYAQAQASFKRHIDDLQTIADWRDELQSRIRRSILRFEFCGLDEEEQLALEAEVEAFKAVCHGLGEAVSLSDEELRRAAA